MSLAQAVGTTFTVDLVSALAVPLSFAARSLGETPDPIGVMEAVRSCADRIDIFYQAGQAAVPMQASDVLAFIEPVLHPVKAPRAGHLFHPKVWFLKFGDPDGEVAYRLVCSTRNLTSDRSWDAVISLDGVPGSRKIGGNQPVFDFLRALPDLCAGDLSADRRKRIGDLAAEAMRVVWDPTEPGTELSFHALGLKRKSALPDFSGYRRLVISPFIDLEGLETVAPRSGQGTVVIARAEQLDRLPSVPEGVDIRVLSVLAELEDERAGGELTGLHAKMTIVERARLSHLFIGSANATRAAYDGNVEFLVEVVRGGKKYGVDAHLAVDTGMGAMLEEYTRQPAEVDPDDDKRYELENLVRTLATRPWALSVRSVASTFDLSLSVTGDLPSTGARVTVELLTRRGEAIQLDPNKPVDVVFTGVALADITPFLVLTAQDGSLRVTSVVPAQLNGDPTDRLDAVLARQVDSPEKFMKFLLLILGLSAGEGPTGNDPGPMGSGAWNTGNAAVFELLARALADNPGSLDDLARIVDRLQRTEAGRAVMPTGFLEIWTTVAEARKLIGGRA